MAPVPRHRQRMVPDTHFPSVPATAAAVRTAAVFYTSNYKATQNLVGMP
eukprot:SAG11_NODE_37377_length_257_cov_0.651899_1_plen_48_part_10